MIASKSFPFFSQFLLISVTYLFIGMPHGLAMGHKRDEAPPPPQSLTLVNVTTTTAKTILIEKNHTLSKVVHDKDLGFFYETLEQQQTLRRQAKQYLESKHLFTKSLKCDGDTENPYCHLFTGTPNLISKILRLRNTWNAKRGVRMRISKVHQCILKQKWDDIGKAAECDVNKAFDQILTQEKVDRLASAIIRKNVCVASSVLTAFALKYEEFFPNEAAYENAVWFYKKAIDCAPSTSTVKAQYRYSLLKLWKNKYEEAMPVLKQLIQMPEAKDYQPRSYFWASYCAEKLKDANTQALAQSKLFAEYPMSLHGLLLLKDRKVRTKEFLDREDPEITFRTKTDTSLNYQIRAAEALLDLGEQKLASTILENTLLKIGNTEPAFQIYVGALFSRADNGLGKFKLLSTLFHDHPQMISRTLLELFYPLEHFAVRTGAGLEPDEFMLLALIRQESAFNRRAKSPAGAVGLMQIMLATARKFERISHARLFDPATNVRIGSHYFSNLIKRYNGDVELALASYNAGPEQVDNWIRRYPIEHRLLFLDLIPFKETREYVAAIARNYYWYLSLYSNSTTEAASTKENTAAGAPTPRFLLFGS